VASFPIEIKEQERKLVVVTELPDLKKRRFEGPHRRQQVGNGERAKAGE
jgi:hypothetical protein